MAGFGPKASVAARSWYIQVLTSRVGQSYPTRLFVVFTCSIRPPRQGRGVRPPSRKTREQQPCGRFRPLLSWTRNLVLCKSASSFETSPFRVPATVCVEASRRHNRDTPSQMQDIACMRGESSRRPGSVEGTPSSGASAASPCRIDITGSAVVDDFTVCCSRWTPFDNICKRIEGSLLFPRSKGDIVALKVFETGT